MPTEYGTTPNDSGQAADAWCGMGDETHTGVLATRVFEFNVPDRRSGAGETDRHYLLICGSDSCLAAAEAEARFWNATHTDFYSASPADCAAIVGAA